MSRFSQVSPTDALHDPLLRREVAGPWRSLVSDLRCPRCLGELEEEEAGCRCRSCAVAWPVTGGLPWFAGSSRHYHADVPERQMRRLLEETAQQGWRRAFAGLLTRLPAERSEILRHNVLDPSRALGLDLLPLRPDSRVLDVGCGWGTLTLPLARRTALAVGLDLAALRARFTQLRAAEEGLDNLLVTVGGDLDHLPFASNFFDALLLNGVLEWTAVSRGGKPARVYREFLKEARRVLKPGGLLYIGIENRTSLVYLRGGREDHVELPWVALMPRRLADVYARWRRGIAYRTHTHSLPGYRRLLRESGFPRHRFYYPQPDYRRPRLVVPLDDRVGLRHALLPASRSRWRRRLAAMVIASGLFRFLPHSYLIVAVKPGAAS